MAITLRLTSVMVDDQAKALDVYGRMLGFSVKHDIPMGEHRWLTLTAPGGPDGVELLLEPTGHPAAAPFRQALYADGVPATAFGADDIHAEYARLTALGLAFKSEPLDIGSTTIATFDDTCGNWIQLFQV